MRSVLLIVLFTTSALGLYWPKEESAEVLDKCGYCDQSKCPPITQCPMGNVKDRCECCSICGLEQQQRCNTAEELRQLFAGSRSFGWYGRCGIDLECQGRTDVDEDLLGKENICMCLRPERYCASDGKTYSACELKVVQAKSPHITTVSLGDCNSEPVITNYSPSQRVAEGDKTTFWCEIKGYPMPVVNWFFMPPDDNYKVIILPGESGDMSVSLRGARPGNPIVAYLQISKFGVKNQGTYQCFVENDFGSARQNISAIYTGARYNNGFYNDEV